MDDMSKYQDGVGWRHEVKHSMLRRMKEHDYLSRSIYMITLVVEGRRSILGNLKWSASDASDAMVEPSNLGKEVERCWYDIPHFYPEVQILDFQLMPDHFHGLLFVKKNMDVHLGQIINGFKVGCNRAYRVLFLEAVPQDTQPAMPQDTQAALPKHPLKGMLFETSYQDSVLKGKGQLDNMFRYIHANPRRLAIKRMNPDYFKVVTQLRIGDATFAAIGNKWLLERPVRMQVRCHNNTTEENLSLIEKQKEYFLTRARKGGVIISPCISPGEKEIARAVLEASLPLVVILENGFPPMYKPPGRYFTACAEGLLLMLAPWPYHMEKRTITRQQCLELNAMAKWLSTEQWTQELENEIANGS